MALSTLPFAQITGATLHALTLILAAPPPDPTGVNAAFTRIAILFASVIGGVVAFFVVVNGYMYITSGEDTRQTYAKRAMGTLLFGALIVILGANIAPAIITAISGR